MNIEEFKPKPKKQVKRVHWVYYNKEYNMIVTACSIHINSSIKTSSDKEETTCHICMRSYKFKGF